MVTFGPVAVNSGFNGFQSYRRSVAQVGFCLPPARFSAPPSDISVSQSRLSASHSRLAFFRTRLFQTDTRLFPSHTRLAERNPGYLSRTRGCGSSVQGGSLRTRGYLPQITPVKCSATAFARRKTPPNSLICPFFPLFQPKTPLYRGVGRFTHPFPTDVPPGKTRRQTKT